MSDTEKGARQGQVPAVDPDEEAAAAKLWTVYIGEAEKYDKSLVESWKSDMEAMLIFAGLFSASLTAFIIESYKTLTPDTGNATVHLLTQISQQLAAAANGSTFAAPPPTPFTPAPTSVVCNALWFISLGLCLTCALIATLLEQWARDFLHKADMRSAPVIRARIYSYLYYGMKRFNMHTVVDVIPLLLHASLLFFFAGLVAFLIPIHLGMTVVAAGLSTIVIAVYSLLTFLPLQYLDCPYHTPLSSAFWHLSRQLMEIWQHRHHQGVEVTTNTPDSLSMVEAMSHRATEASTARTTRDFQALVWTVKSLADDTELEPFVEAIPDLLWGPDRRRQAYEDHIQKLIRDPDLRLLSRIEGLLLSHESGLLTPEASKRRQITCYKALWAIAALQTCSNSSHYLQPLNFKLAYSMGNDLDILHYSTSASALMDWNTFCGVKSHLSQLLKYLALCEGDLKNGHIPDLERVTSYLRALGSGDLQLGRSPKILYHLNILAGDPPPPLAVVIPELVRVIEDYCTGTPYRLLFQYLKSLASLNSPPYRWRETQKMITLDPSPSFSALQGDLELALESVIYRHQKRLNESNDNSWIDTIIQTLYFFWKPNQTCEPTALPRAIIYYLNNRSSDYALGRCMWPYDLKTWPAFPITISKALTMVDPSRHEMGIEGVLTSLWRLCSLRGPWIADADTAIHEAVLEAVMDADSTPLTFSIIAMVKTRILNSLGHAPDESAFKHWLLPTDTAVVISPQIIGGQMTDGKTLGTLLQNRVEEAKIALLSDFLEGCGSGFVPYKAAETLDYIGTIVPQSEIHETYQIHLANSMHRLWNHNKSHGTELLNTLITCKIFDLYAEFPNFNLINVSGERHAWLDNAGARAQIKDTLSGYVKKLAFESTSGAPSVLTRAQAVLRGLDSLHLVI
ncbi:hypothetical protein FB451DRAFT_1238208 [Mycena latifolia]|nr:hypothetical protein FB451DRAFT_1238208 [Mycena latifolia]